MVLALALDATRTITAAAAANNLLITLLDIGMLLNFMHVNGAPVSNRRAALYWRSTQKFSFNFRLPSNVPAGGRTYGNARMLIANDDHAPSKPLENNITEAENDNEGYSWTLIHLVGSHPASRNWT
jgi:hypothetical protein